MKYLKETTDWSDAGYRVPNHTYIVENNRMFGYITEDGKWEYTLDKPCMFDKKGRTFKDVTREYS